MYEFSHYDKNDTFVPTSIRLLSLVGTVLILTVVVFQLINHDVSENTGLLNRPVECNSQL